MSANEIITSYCRQVQSTLTFSRGCDRSSLPVQCPGKREKLRVHSRQGASLTSLARYSIYPLSLSNHRSVFRFILLLLLHGMGEGLVQCSVQVASATFYPVSLLPTLSLLPLSRVGEALIEYFTGRSPSTSSYNDILTASLADPQTQREPLVLDIVRTMDPLFTPILDPFVDGVRTPIIKVWRHSAGPLRWPLHFPSNLCFPSVYL